MRTSYGDRNSGKILAVKFYLRSPLQGNMKKVATSVVVLVVEDEPILLMSAVDFIEEAGFTVISASNADEAIAILEKRDDIEIIFTDIHMPGSMDGLKLAHYVRGRWPPVKFLITSGLAHPQPEDLPVGSEFIGKPYQSEDVAYRLRAIIG